jgi:RNA polymerase sigma-70 factor (ECF subfamily)
MELDTRKNLGVATEAQLPWDDAEFEALFLAQYDGIYRFLFRIVGSRQDAEDLVQETFLRLLHQRFPQGRHHNVRAWLYRVATNLAYNALRGRTRQERRQEAAYQSALSEQPSDPAEVALRSEEREVVRRVLAGLPLRQAQLLLLRYAGLSYRELAEVTHVAPGSVGTLLARAEAAFEATYRAEAMTSERGTTNEM